LVAWVFPGIASLIVIAIFALPRKRWLRGAHRMARIHDIPLPPYLEDRVTRFQRNTYLFGTLVNWIALPLANGIIKRTISASPPPWFPEVLAAAPLYLAVLCYSYTLGVRWRASGRPRVAHLGRLSPWRAFTPIEVINVVLGVAGTATAIGYGLRLTHASPGWWAACAAGLAIALVAWWHLVRTLMDRRSSASDKLELGWDDVLRFEQVRGFTMVFAWLPATYILFADQGIVSGQAIAAGGGFDFGWMYLVAAIWFLTFLTFRQGRLLWRRAWEQPGNPRPEDLHLAWMAGSRAFRLTPR
jgi:hypothetical protein